MGKTKINTLLIWSNFCVGSKFYIFKKDQIKAKLRYLYRLFLRIFMNIILSFSVASLLLRSLRAPFYTHWELWVTFIGSAPRSRASSTPGGACVCLLLLYYSWNVYQWISTKLTNTKKESARKTSFEAVLHPQIGVYFLHSIRRRLKTATELERWTQAV